MSKQTTHNRRIIGITASFILITFILAGVSLITHWPPQFYERDNSGVHTKAVYTCPMHPNYISDKPGECPICGMTLVPAEEEKVASQHQETPVSQDTGKETPTKKERKVLYWVAPMDPSYRSDKPGKSPMGMDLIPVYADEVEGGESEASPEGLTQVLIDSRRQQLIGIESVPAVMEKATKTIRTVGTVMYDETRLSHIHTKIRGWVEKIYVDFTGQWVHKGQPLLEIYSPELVATQEEYLRALRLTRETEASGRKELIESTRRLVESARKRLKLWDIQDAEIAHLERVGESKKALVLFSPVQGYVIDKKAFLGIEVHPQMELYTLADLTQVWVEASIYEYEIADVKVGLPAKLTLSYYPGKEWSGKVDYIYPYLDVKTRTNQVRFTFPNPTYELKPGMYVNVELSIDKGQQLVVPDSAVMDTGTQHYVFIARANGYFEPRKVIVGEKMGDRRVIISGLKEGDPVVVSGNFLIDSESRLKAALKGMTGKGGDHHDH